MIRKNAIANYIGTFYTILIGIVILPFYLKYIGAEAFGLVGFFALLQTWLNVLDMGISPTLGRQAAFARGKKNGFIEFSDLLKSFEMIFLVIAIGIVVSIYIFDDWFAIEWIKAADLPIATVSFCISIMGGIIGFRWFTALYRSGILGLEQQVWLNGISAFIASLRFIGSLALLHFVSSDISVYFGYQLAISVIELIIMRIKFYSLLPAGLDLSLRFSSKIIKEVMPFTFGMAYLTGLWLLITQLDKLLLSRFLSLGEFGYFTLVAIVAGGISQLANPISQALLPRMTLLLSQNEEGKMLDLYRSATQIVAVIVFSITVVIAFNAKELLYAWTGDVQASIWGGRVLFWFALGNCIMAIGAFQYYLQFAHGKLKMHVIGSTISALIQVPLVYFAASHYGALGVGIAWFVFQLIYFIFWTPIVHAKFAPGLHLKWLFLDIAPILLVALTINYFINSMVVNILGLGRVEILIKLLFIGGAVLFVTSVSSSAVRKYAIDLLKKNNDRI